MQRCCCCGQGVMTNTPGKREGLKLKMGRKRTGRRLGVGTATSGYGERANSPAAQSKRVRVIFCYSGRHQLGHRRTGGLPDRVGACCYSFPTISCREVENKNKKKTLLITSIQKFNNKNKPVAICLNDNCSIPSQLSLAQATVQITS